MTLSSDRKRFFCDSNSFSSSPSREKRQRLPLGPNAKGPYIYACSLPPPLPLYHSCDLPKSLQKEILEITTRPALIQTVRSGAAVEDGEQRVFERIGAAGIKLGHGTWEDRLRAMEEQCAEIDREQQRLRAEEKRQKKLDAEENRKYAQMVAQQEKENQNQAKNDKEKPQPEKEDSLEKVNSLRKVPVNVPGTLKKNVGETKSTKNPSETKVQDGKTLLKGKDGVNIPSDRKIISNDVSVSSSDNMSKPVSNINSAEIPSAPVSRPLAANKFNSRPRSGTTCGNKWTREGYVEPSNPNKVPLGVRESNKTDTSINAGEIGEKAKETKVPSPPTKAPTPPKRTPSPLKLATLIEKEKEVLRKSMSATTASDPIKNVHTKNVTARTARNKRTREESLELKNSNKIPLGMRGSEKEDPAITTSETIHGCNNTKISEPTISDGEKEISRPVSTITASDGVAVQPITFPVPSQDSCPKPMPSFEIHTNSIDSQKLKGTCITLNITPGQPSDYEKLKNTVNDHTSSQIPPPKQIPVVSTTINHDPSNPFASKHYRSDYEKLRSHKNGTQPPNHRSNSGAQAPNYLSSKPSSFTSGPGSQRSNSIHVNPNHAIARSMVDMSGGSLALVEPPSITSAGAIDKPVAKDPAPVMNVSETTNADAGKPKPKFTVIGKVTDESPQEAAARLRAFLIDWKLKNESP